MTDHEGHEPVSIDNISALLGLAENEAKLAANAGDLETLAIACRIRDRAQAQLTQLVDKAINNILGE